MNSMRYACVMGCCALHRMRRGEKGVDRKGMDGNARGRETAQE